MAVELKAQKRHVFGKKLIKLRGQNFIPAELYGRNVKNIHLSVAVKDFKKILKEAGESSVVDLVFDDNKHRPVLIHGIHYHPLSNAILNVDFYQVRLDEVTKANVLLEFVGESPAVENQNGVLVKVIQEVEVEALPGDIPRKIDVDITQLIDVDHSLYVKDLPPLKNVKIITDPDSVIASVKAQMTEEEEKALEEEGKDVGKIEIEGKTAEKDEENKDEDNEGQSQETAK